MRYVLLVAAVILGAKIAFLLLSPVLGLATTTWIIDDAFIEMAVARNIAMGHGFTYDFVHATTGSPFLWTYLLAINFALFSKALAIKASLILSSVFAAASTIVVFVIAKQVTNNRGAAWIAFLLATFTGNAFFEAMNGMDTAIFTFFVLMSVGATLGIGIPKRASPFVRGLLIGLWTGLSMTVRGDGIFIGFAIGCMLLWQWLRAQDKRDAARVLAGFALLSVLGFGVLTMWQLVRTGSPMLANQVGRRELALALHNFSFDHFSLLKYLKIVGWNVFQLEHLMSVAAGSSLLCIIALCYAFTKKETRSLSIITLLYTATFFATLVAYQWYFPDFHGLRYVNPAVHLFSILIAALLTHLFTDRSRKVILTFITAAIIILSQYRFYDLAVHMPWAKSMSMIARPSATQIDAWQKPVEWVKAHLPKASILGVRDHGRIALFSELPIQDLAGNIDPNVPKMIKKPNGGTLLREYFKTRHVTHLFLIPPTVRNDFIYQVIYKAFTLKKIPEASTDTAVLYQIVW